MSLRVCWLFYLQVVKSTLAVALQVETVKEEGDVAVLGRFQDDGAVLVVGVDVRPARTLQVAVLLFIGPATAWKSPPQTQSEHCSRTIPFSTHRVLLFYRAVQLITFESLIQFQNLTITKTM